MALSAEFRKSAAHSFSSRSTAINWSFGIIEFLGLISFGVNFFDKSIWGAVALTIIIVRSGAAAGYYIAVQMDDYSLRDTYRLLINTTYFISILMFLVFAHNSLISYSESKKHDSPEIAMAKSQLVAAQSQLKEVQASHSYSPDELSNSQSERANLESQMTSISQQYDAQIAALKSSMESQHAQTVQSARNQLNAFWERKDVTGIKVRQILTDDCTALSFQGSPMTTAAKRLCPQLKALKSMVDQSIPDSPEIANLRVEKQSKLNALESKRVRSAEIAQKQARILTAEQAVRTAEQAFFDAQSRLNQGVVYYPFITSLSQVTGINENPIFLFIAFIFAGVIFGAIILFSGTTVKLNSEGENQERVESNEESVFTKLKKLAYTWLNEKVRKMSTNTTNKPEDVKDAATDTENGNSIPIKQKPVQPPVQTEQSIPFNAVPSMSFAPMYDANKRLIEILHTQDVPCTYSIHPDLQEKVNVVQQLNTDTEYGVRTNDVYTKNAQNFDSQYGRVLVCIKSGVITNLSYPTLRSHGYTNTVIKRIREKLVRDGIAVVNSKKECELVVGRGKKQGE
jgi:hypothetical protein